MTLRVLVTDPFPEAGVAILKDAGLVVEVRLGLPRDGLRAALRGYDALIVRSETKVTAEVLDGAGALKIIGRAGVGLDNVDVEAASKRGIIVMNVPAGNTISTAELTFSLLLALARNIPQADAALRAGQWTRQAFVGTELYGKTLGVIGLGKIGTEVARRAMAFGMRVIAADPYLSADRARELELSLVALDELLATADFITIHTPLTDETRGLLSTPQFAKMKRGVRLVNSARGGIVDEQALYTAIQAGQVAGAALDVFEREPVGAHPLLTLPQVVATPHLGASTEEAQSGVAMEIARQVADALLGRGIRNAVNVFSADPEVLRTLQPYLALAEKLGALQAQLAEGQISQVRIRCSGDLTNHDLTPVTVALIKGLLTPALQESVNYVNASMIASERGIRVIESKSSHREEFANLIWCEVTASKWCSTVAGTLFASNNPRIVKIDDMYVDAVPAGYMVIAFTKDAPGLVGTIGSLLGEAGINIGGMTFGREQAGGKAITVLNIDQPVSPALIRRIAQQPNVYDARLIKL